MFPLGISIAVSLADAAAPTSRQGTPIECAVALQAIEDQTARQSKPIVLSTDDPTYLHLKAEYLAQGWWGDEDDESGGVHPPPEALSEFVGDIRNSIPRCPSIRKWLDAHKIGYGKAAVEAVAARAVDDELPADILDVSLPAVSSDGQVALIYMSSTFNGFAHLYRRQGDGTWKHIASHMLWIS